MLTGEYQLVSRLYVTGMHFRRSNPPFELWMTTWNRKAEWGRVPVSPQESQDTVVIFAQRDLHEMEWNKAEKYFTTKPVFISNPVTYRPKLWPVVHPWTIEINTMHAASGSKAAY